MKLQPEKKRIVLETTWKLHSLILNYVPLIVDDHLEVAWYGIAYVPEVIQRQICAAHLHQLCSEGIQVRSFLLEHDFLHLLPTILYGIEDGAIPRPLQHLNLPLLEPL